MPVTQEKTEGDRSSERNSRDDTSYLLSTDANRRSLMASVAQLRAGKFIERDLIEQ